MIRKIIKDSNDPEDYKAYLEEYPQGKFVKLATNRLRRLTQSPPNNMQELTAKRQAEEARLAELQQQRQTAEELARLAELEKQRRAEELRLSELQQQRQAAEETARLAANSKERELAGIDFVKIPAGCFNMGSPDSEAERGSDEGPVHKVCVDGFWLGKYEVTQGQWQAVMGNNPAKFKNGDNYPVEGVSWNDTQEFIKKLNAKGVGKFRLQIFIVAVRQRRGILYAIIVPMATGCCAVVRGTAMPRTCALPTVTGTVPLIVSTVAGFV